MSSEAPILLQGYVLKKRRKKMQGYARRYFTLYENGLLSYSFEPGGAARDQIALHDAAISTVKNRRDVINLDSSTGTFHLKCLSSQDFDSWINAFRKFVGSDPTRRSASFRASTRRTSLQISSKSNTILDEMGLSILELESAIIALKHDLTKPKNDKEAAPKFGLFKRSSHHSSPEPSPEPSPLQRLQDALNSLKTQHTSLSKSIQTWAHIDSAMPAPLPIAEEEEQEDQRSSSPINRRLKRASTATSISDLSEWFDASSALGEGAQEFVVDSADAPDPSRLLVDENQTGSQADISSIDTDAEDDSPDPTQHALQIVRRTQLPAPATGDEGSLFAVLKKNVGKDLSATTFPVTFNEPLTLLQRTAEELEYHDLLDKAAAATDPVERLSYVAAFAVSGYAHTRYRSGRKGFNPMLGETFEDVRMKFIAEKVRHNPLEMAFHAEGRGWELWGTSTGKTKFWGKSLEVIPLGTTYLKIGDERFQWKKPSSFVRNLMVGTKYLEHCGKMTINTSHDTRCVLDFKQSSYWAASNVVAGTIYNSDGNATANLEGKWDDQFSQSFDASHLRVLWRVAPWSKNAHEYYGFTTFGITLNEMTSDTLNKLPPTDSRYRPDVRALEEGDLDLAEEEKNRLEELQRRRRRDGTEPSARWFKLDTNNEWVYVGGYWDSRVKGWKGTRKIEPLW